MAAIHAFSRYGAVVGVISELHPFIFCLTQMLAPAGGGALAYIAQFCSQAIADQVKKGGSNKRGDILSSMYADGFSIEDIQYHSIPNIGAGSDTTAISLSAAIYFLLKNPEKMVKLRKELDEKRAQGRFSTLITNREAQECTYLQAVLKETFRLHPGNGLPMPRVVPKGGLALAGCFFPEGVRPFLLSSHSRPSVTDQSTVNRRHKLLRRPCQHLHLWPRRPPLCSRALACRPRNR